jgi:hypothetical protein
MPTRKAIIRAAILANALTLTAGCMTHEETSLTMPPYASMSDDSREPSSAPSPVVVPEISGPPATPHPKGVVGETADVIKYPFRALGDWLGGVF